jgi:hypothetical protein
VKKNHNGYIIRLSENALIALALNGLEAYSIMHLKNKRSRSKLETYGSLFGYETHMPDNRILYNVELANVHTSSQQEGNHVTCDDESIKMKAETIRAFWPQYKYLGDFHTHSYGQYTEAMKIKGYYLSKSDRDALLDNRELWKSVDYRLGLVVTIAALEKRGGKPARYVDSNFNCIEFTLRNTRFWVSGYCAYHNKNGFYYTDDNSELVMLDCPVLIGHMGEYAESGQVVLKGKTRKPHYLSNL